MQISTGQDGIQRLLAAEQEAQKIVTAARKGRSALINAFAQRCCIRSAAQRAQQGGSTEQTPSIQGPDTLMKCPRIKYRGWKSR